MPRRRSAMSAETSSRTSVSTSTQRASAPASCGTHAQSLGFHVHATQTSHAFMKKPLGHLKSHQYRDMRVDPATAESSSQALRNPECALCKGTVV